jgi:hypothetical protein
MLEILRGKGFVEKRNDYETVYVELILEPK